MSIPSIKVLLLGARRVGKTTLIKTYVMGSDYTDNYRATIGVDFASKAVTSNKGKVSLMIWDTAGKDRGLGRMLYKETKIILLAFSLTDPSSVEEMDVEIKGIQEFIEEPLPTCVVGIFFRVCG